MEYDEWAKEEVETMLLEKVRSLETLTPQKETRPQTKWSKVSCTMEQGEKARGPYTTETSNILVLIFVFFAVLFPSAFPALQIAYLFGVALLLSILTHSSLARLAMVGLTASYFLLALLVIAPFNLSDVWTFFFGTNLISSFPPLLGIAVGILILGAGLLQGAVDKTRFAGLIIVIPALVLSITDAVLAGVAVGSVDWYFSWISHLAFYTMTFLLIWGLGYLPVRIIREGIKRLR